MFAAAGFENITENDGVWLAITGMLIVFTALVLIATFIALLPRVLARLEYYFPEPAHPHHAPSSGDSRAAPAAATADAEVAAAIGYALHLRGQQHSGEK